MFKGLGNIAGIMKSAQQLQDRMGAMNDALAELRVEGTAGGGMVKIEATAQQKVTGCQIEEAIFAAGDREMIEELIVSAVNQALEKAKQAQAEQMSRMAGDLNLPGLGDMMQKFGMGGVPDDDDSSQTDEP
ncbi:MAG: YbaB/EbfC family nucleoid-associated protein [Planctomycetaceae bacterium]|nr:YbaB/EbfC family nucleoid-associated protein [Planctomycetaceae bacterium]MCA9113180.1 YbaB/EbfC family nucleoid-associated protein [Planctomycetaceae bacterium]